MTCDEAIRDTRAAIEDTEQLMARYPHHVCDSLQVGLDSLYRWLEVLEEEKADEALERAARERGETG